MVIIIIIYKVYLYISLQYSRIFAFLQLNKQVLNYQDFPHNMTNLTTSYRKNSPRFINNTEYLHSPYTFITCTGKNLIHRHEKEKVVYQHKGKDITFSMCLYK
jgi:hypothetical protein